MNNFDKIDDWEKKLDELENKNLIYKLKRYEKKELKFLRQKKLDSKHSIKKITKKKKKQFHYSTKI